ncbi:MAG TPA: 30S ribosomal protein S17 [Verrucomicrobia bacterium]|jgi:small subunit ribosomal protein S17|nr:30S ribosomal protein S17 [Verrucomicrobiota bacterium]
MTEQPEKQRKLRKQRVGVVVSDRMDKTIVVRVDRHVRHPLYEKVVRLTTKFAVHDEDGQAKVGDRVRIMETRPLSKTKCWRLVKILSH